MQHGADLRLIDLQGKNAMHHAVMGGSMWVTAQHKFDIHHVVVCQHYCKQVYNISRSPFPVLLCIICGRRECFGSQTQICTMWHHFTWRHPQETQMWSGICSETRYDGSHSLTCSHFVNSYKTDRKCSCHRHWELHAFLKFWSLNPRFDLIVKCYFNQSDM